MASLRDMRPGSLWLVDAEEVVEVVHRWPSARLMFYKSDGSAECMHFYRKRDAFALLRALAPARIEPRPWGEV